MLSDTLEDGLRAYEIGAKVKSLRQRKGLGVVQLGSHTGLSAAMISKIERGQLHPTLPTLLRIALVFGVGLEHFFVVADARAPITVVRAGDRLRLPVSPGDETPPYFFESLTFPATNAQLEGYFAEFPAGAEASDPHTHRGAELVFVTKGALAIETAVQTVELATGDAAYLDPEAPHAYRNAGKTPARALVVVAAA